MWGMVIYNKEYTYQNVISAATDYHHILTSIDYHYFQTEIPPPLNKLWFLPLELMPSSSGSHIRVL